MITPTSRYKVGKSFFWFPKLVVNTATGEVCRAWGWVPTYFEYSYARHTSSFNHRGEWKCTTTAFYFSNDKELVLFFMLREFLFREKIVYHPSYGASIIDYEQFEKNHPKP